MNKLVLLILALWPAGVPPEFVEVDVVDSYRGCTLHIGRANASGIAPLRARCHWSDVTVAQMRAVLVRYTQYGEFIGVMEKPGIIVAGVDGGRALVWQHDDLGFPLGHREARTWMDTKEVPGGFVVTWDIDKKPFEFLRDGSETMNDNSGAWTVTAAPDGGVDVVQDMSIDPGGFVPNAIINWFQTYGLATELAAVHSAAQRRAR